MSEKTSNSKLKNVGWTLLALTTGVIIWQEIDYLTHRKEYDRDAADTECYAYMAEEGYGIQTLARYQADPDYIRLKAKFRENTYLTKDCDYKCQEEQVQGQQPTVNQAYVQLVLNEISTDYLPSHNRLFAAQPIYNAPIDGIYDPFSLKHPSEIDLKAEEKFDTLVIGARQEAEASIYKGDILMSIAHYQDTWPDKIWFSQLNLKDFYTNLENNGYTNQTRLSIAKDITPDASEGARMFLLRAAIHNTWCMQGYKAYCPVFNFKQYCPKAEAPTAN